MQGGTTQPTPRHRGGKGGTTKAHRERGNNLQPHHTTPHHRGGEGSNHTTHQTTGGEGSNPQPHHTTGGGGTIGGGGGGGRTGIIKRLRVLNDKHSACVGLPAALTPPMLNVQPRLVDAVQRRWSSEKMNMGR